MIRSLTFVDIRNLQQAPVEDYLEHPVEEEPVRPRCCGHCALYSAFPGNKKMGHCDAVVQTKIVGAKTRACSRGELVVIRKVWLDAD